MNEQANRYRTDSLEARVERLERGDSGCLGVFLFVVVGFAVLVPWMPAIWYVCEWWPAAWSGADNPWMTAAYELLADFQGLGEVDGR